MTMSEIRIKAEWWAWVTWQAYIDGAKHGLDLSRTDRAVHLWKAREYKRRAIRVSQWLNARADSGRIPPKKVHRCASYECCEPTWE